jgi:hypothetical protein
MCPGAGYADDLRHKLDVLRDHCHSTGRDYAEIEKTTATMVDLGAIRGDGRNQLIDHLYRLAELGIDQAIISASQPWDLASLDVLADVLADIHAMPSRVDAVR